LMRAVPMFVVAGLFFGLQAPPTWAAALGYAAAMLGALLLACAIWTVATISLLWTISGEGIVRMAPALVYTLSGMLVPLPLLPAWAQAALQFLPFRGLVDVPFRIYMGSIPAADIFSAIAHQLAWTAALVLLGRWLL